jgi:hypothetical protein
MLTCKRMTELASDRAEGGLGLLERVRFDRHLAGCDGCRAHVRQLELTREALARLPEPEVPPALNDALLSQFDAWSAARSATSTAALPETARGAPVSPWPVAAGIATFGVILAIGEPSAVAPRDWILAAFLAGAAILLAALAGRFAAGLVAAAAVAAAVTAALVSGKGGGLEAGHGVYCLGFELVAGHHRAGAAWFGARGGPRMAVRRSMASGAVAGALAADAALQIVCGGAGATPHLFAFHVGGVILAGAVAVVYLRERGGRAAA